MKSNATIVKNYTQFLFEKNINTSETIDEFCTRFENENSNPTFLKNNFKNENFKLLLTHDGNVKIKKYNSALPNKCESNVFNFIKNMANLNNHRYYPVSGWAFLESTTYFEHFWIYDALDNVFLDITPMSDKLPYAYGGVINFNINDDISKADKYNQIPFLLGKTANSLYTNDLYKTNTSVDISTKTQTLFDFIYKNVNYKDLSAFIKTNNISSIEELEKYIPKIQNIIDNTKNNRDYDLYTKLLNQIKYLNI